MNRGSLLAKTGNRLLKNIPRLTLSALVIGCAHTGARTSIQGGAGPRTRAERSGYTETSHYADVIVFIDSLRGRKELSFGVIGKTTQGRDIPYVIASRPRVSSPAEARALGRPIVYVQGNIHAGEVEGKEALLALLRDLTSSSAPNVLDSLVLIAVPIYNADGNEKFASQEVNRGSQNGPEIVGERANGQGLDLNRDYVKAEAPETRASLAMFNAWDPDVFVDLHTTDGSYHGYALTYAPPLNPSAPVGVSARDSLMPVLRKRMQERHGFATFDYGDFISEDTLSKGWVTFDSRPRFGTNYYGLRGHVAILSEAYSHDPFRRRIESTYAFVGEILSLVAERRNTLSVAFDVYPRDSVAIRSVLIAAPDSVAVIAEDLEKTGDSSRAQAGVRKGFRRTGRFHPVSMPVYERFRPTLFAKVPLAYVIPPSDTAAVRVLRLHGLTVDTVLGRSIEMVQRFIVDSSIVNPRVFQGHHERQVFGHWSPDEPHELPAGTFKVRPQGPLGLLAVYLLDPQSDDGLTTWNFFDAGIKPGAEHPVLKSYSVPPPNSP